MKAFVRAAAAAVVLVAAGFVVAGPASAVDSLVSQGRPAVASSTEAGRVAGLAVDGNLAGTSSRWASYLDAACDCGSDPEWLQVDLGADHTVSRVVLTWEAAYATAYRVETSADSSTWTPVFATAAGDGGTDDLTVSGTGRYVRVFGTARATQWGYSLFELQVYGSPVVVTPSSTTSPPAGQPAGSTGGTWALRFGDEFDGTALNLNNWRPNWLASTDTAITKGANSAETACMVPGNVTVSGGAAHLALTAGTTSCNGTTKPHRGAVIQSWSDGKTWAPGGTANNCASECYFEARLRLPATSTHMKNWAAFWNNTTGKWPQGGEDDTVETLCGACQGVDGDVSAHYHFPNGSSSGANPPDPAAFRDNGWHTYGSQWSADGTTRWYYDGVLMGSKAGTATTTRHFLILTYTAGTWGGPTEAGNAMDVDYVRVYGR